MKGRLTLLSCLLSWCLIYSGKEQHFIHVLSVVNVFLLCETTGLVCPSPTTEIIHLSLTWVQVSSVKCSYFHKNMTKYTKSSSGALRKLKAWHSSVFTRILGKQWLFVTYWAYTGRRRSVLFRNCLSFSFLLWIFVITGVYYIWLDTTGRDLVVRRKDFTATFQTFRGWVLRFLGGVSL